MQLGRHPPHDLFVASPGLRTRRSVSCWTCCAIRSASMTDHQRAGFRSVSESYVGEIINLLRQGQPAQSIATFFTRWRAGPVGVGTPDPSRTWPSGLSPGTEIWTAAPKCQPRSYVPALCAGSRSPSPVHDREGSQACTEPDFAHDHGCSLLRTRGRQLIVEPRVAHSERVGVVTGQVSDGRHIARSGTVGQAPSSRAEAVIRSRRDP